MTKRPSVSHKPPHRRFSPDTPLKASVGVKAVIINSQSQVLLLKKAHKDHWDIPGGGMQFEEDIPQALHREIKEETGLNVDHLTLLDVSSRRHSRRGFSVYIIYLARVDQLDPSIQLSAEHQQYAWLTPHQALEYDLADRYRQAISLLAGPKPSD